VQWSKLLAADRLGAQKPGRPDPARSPFQVDSDRIVFSSAFRRLQDKTQVFPLADNDYVRTRLTHSLEVASVGRSLGARVGAALVEKHGLARHRLHASDFGAVVQSAALAHDLGNPPYGHSGEESISHWFRKSKIAEPFRKRLAPSKASDFEEFEGNAQGFRIITRLQMPDNPGLRLTCATLGAFSKYPCASTCKTGGHTGASVKKFGVFRSELPLFAEVGERCGLPLRGKDCWVRHPLAFLVEAADDICYRLVDFEDGFRLGHLSYEEVFESFLKVTGDPKDRERAARVHEQKNRISFLRAQAIGAAVGQTADAFLARDSALLAGKFDEPLLDHVPAAEELQRIKARSVEALYNTQRGVMIEVAGHEIIGHLLDSIASAVEDVAEHGKAASPRSRKFIRLIPEQFLGPGGTPDADPYLRLLKITDFVSGMTDNYAVRFSQGIRQPPLP
jgi:dGTPase